MVFPSLASIGTWAGALIAIIAATGCAPNLSSTPSSTFHNVGTPDGSLRVGEVVEVGMVQGRALADQMLVAAGIPAEEIRDKSVILVRNFCCGGPQTLLGVYVPEGMSVSMGDIIEYWSGEMLLEGEPLGPMPNTMTRLVQPANAADRQCRWVPEDPSLWQRRIYCSWMPAEGWIEQGGIYPIWFNPIGAQKPPLPAAQ